MKVLLLMLIVLGSAFSGMSQHSTEPTKPSSQQTKNNFYQLPAEVDYEIFDSKGNFIRKGKGKTIDFSKEEKDTFYFIRYNGETYKFVVE